MYKLLLGALLLCATARAFVEFADFPEETIEAIANHATLSQDEDETGGNAIYCSDQRLAGCQAKFNDYLNISTSVDWTKPEVLAYALAKYYEQSRAGLITVCDARSLFQRCLGPMYRGCTNPLFYISHNFGARRAFAYSGIFRTLRYMCIGGLELGLRNWPCIIRTYKQEESKLEACTHAFNTTVHEHPAQYCTAKQLYVNCYEHPFAKTCDYNGESAMWACELLKSAFPPNVCPAKCHGK